MRIAILGSTRGTDADCILENIANETLTGITVGCIISNRSNAEILDKGKKYDIPSIFLSAKMIDGKTVVSREVYDYKLNLLLKKFGTTHILLIGWMRILSSSFVEKWSNKILNVHPSLLPAFAGEMDMNVHRSVLDRGCKISGATLMFIDDGKDTGPIIDQKPVVVSDCDDEVSLKAKVQQVEQQLLIENLPLLRDNKLIVSNGKVVKIE